MYGKYFVGKRKFAVITLTGMEGRGERGEGPRPFPRTRQEATSLFHPIDPELGVDNSIT